MRIIPFIMLALGLGSAIWAWISRSRKANQTSTPHVIPDLAAYQTTGVLPSDALTHYDWRIRLEAVKQLSPTPDHTVTMISILHDSDTDVREAAVDKLIQIGVPAVEALIDLLDEQSQEVRVTAVKALSRIDTPATTAALIDALDDESSWVREPAAAALGERRASGAVPALIVLLEDSSPQVRKAVVSSLRAINTPEALAALSDLD